MENIHNVNRQVFVHDTNHLYVLAASSTNALVSFFRELKILVWSFNIVLKSETYYRYVCLIVCACFTGSTHLTSTVDYTFGAGTALSIPGTSLTSVLSNLTISLKFSLSNALL